MSKILQFAEQLWLNSGMDTSMANAWAAWTVAIGAVLLSYIIYLALSLAVGPVLTKITQKTPTKIDDILLRRAFVKWVWMILALAVLQYTLPPAFAVAYPKLGNWVDIVIDVVQIGLCTKAAVELLKGIFLIIFDNERVEEEAKKLQSAAENDMEYDYVPSHSLKGLQQMLCIVIICVGVILMISHLLGKNPLIIISGLGAGAAVLMLVFKDSILGVVAGIQLTANDMLRPGDWIIAPKYGANGRVQEVTLATVKVLNWDHTIVTIPPYNLISDSFQNWRKMEESGGRRVTRAVNIDMSSVHFMTQAEAEAFRGEPWAQGVDWSQPVVNLSLFRRYLEYYINHIDTLRPSMLHMVRELEPTPQGLPIEMYFFTSETNWARFERVQAQAFDHILAMVPRFGLRVFQAPTGADLRQLAPTQAAN